ncbi:MAG: allantoate amidohydrolase [Micropruina sp.]|uniref:allantoate amidohydrolase n=1 Tax=Micropruina sp. TaxID=2737536 RepID=UPI0039E51762
MRAEASVDPVLDRETMLRAGRRAYDRCDELAALSAVKGSIHRFHLTSQHAWANALVGRWMTEAGLQTRIDAGGNLVGRIEGSSPGLPAVMLGSHIDTVPDAGRYDGPLGVMLAIEVVDLLRDAMPGMPCALEVVAFSDEEGARFGSALLGSNAVAGNWRDEWLDQTDVQGTTLRQAFRDFGLDPARVRQAARRPDELVAYLEAHIEQGPLLEAYGRPLGVVTSIAGARRFALSVTGEARHAGGTPYDRRRDALVGASFAVLAIESIARRRDIIGTVGEIHAYPGAVNVVPGRVEFSLDLRAETDAERDAGWAEILDTITGVCQERNLEFHWVEEHRARAVACAGWLRQAIADAVAVADPEAEEVPMLYSRAGHDAMVMADVTDIGMLFIRCEDGISHAPAEAVTPWDVALAVEAFAAATRTVLTADRPTTDRSADA